MVGALLLDQSRTLAGKREIVGALEQRSGRERFHLRRIQGPIAERLGKLQWRGWTHTQIARQLKQRLLVLVHGNQQRLLVVGKLDLRAEHVHARRGSGVVLVFGQLAERG